MVSGFKAFDIIILIAACFFYAGRAKAQMLPDKLKEAIDYILEKSEALCGSVSPNGSQQSYSIQGDIRAQLPGILRKPD
jgi:hypothetical protein